MINGTSLRNAIISGANNIFNNKQRVDELNVFPVPDGDTGTNMSMTMSAAVKELVNLKESATVAEVAKTNSHALLRGARGNSGVILSLLFRGFAKGLDGQENATAKQLAQALKIGVESAYKAVMKPTEGTVLTVARVAAEKACEKADSFSDEAEFFDYVCQVAEDTLNQTPEMLPVLKKAGVVDAGGMGFLVVLQGMRSYIKDGVMIDNVEGNAKPAPSAKKKSAAAEYDGEITFAYCTEFLVVRSGNKDSLVLRSYLESIGDSVVVVDDENIIKVHVHTNHPGNALEKALEFGALINLKIENMKEQHENASNDQDEESEEVENGYVAPDDSIPYGFVSVCAGEGISNLFSDLGVDKIVSGGQTMNPSTDDILNAVQSIPAKTVFVLPNNKNIIMAAEQCVPLADREVIVLHTKTIPQGVSAMLAFDGSESVEDNHIAMSNAIKTVGTGQVTYAARDSDYDGHKIKKGEILAMENGKVSFVEKDMNKAVVKLAKSLVNKNSSFITLFYGSDVTESEANKVLNVLNETLSSNVEITLIDGGQPVYYYILSVE